MYITYIGHNHIHDMDFKIERPNGCKDYLALLIKSPAEFQLEGKTLYTQPNIFFLYAKDTPQYYKAYEQAFSNDWFNFELEEQDLEFFNQLHIPLETPIPIQDISFFSFLIKNMAYEYYAECTYSHEALEHYLKLFFLKIAGITDSFSIKEESGYYEKLSLLRSKVYSAPYNEWSIEGLAHEITLSTYYFQHLYKKAFGISCLRDIINARIEYAKYYLTQTNLSIKYIAETCGYKNDVHFMRQFKSITHLTPTEYRLAHRNK